MKHKMRIFVEFALAMGLLVPVALAQKPPAPTPAPPPSAPPRRPLTSDVGNSQPSQPTEDLVVFLMGRVTTDDGTPIPNDVLVERVCNLRVRQQVYANHGDFSMQMGSMVDSFVDASGDWTPQQVGVARRDPEMGIPRRELAKCELRVSLSGFYPKEVNLAELTDFGTKSLDVGSVVVQRRTKIAGTTLSAASYNAPKNARRSYEKGLDAEKKGKLADARTYLEKAVEIYPKYVNAWFQLGTVLRKENQKDAARTAFAQATTIDNRFSPPYLSLASMAFEEEHWTDVLNLTGHILHLDPLNHLTGYILDLDPFDYAEVYFYNAVANYRLNRIDDAEKSGLKAEQVDLRSRFPQLHLLLAEIFARKNKYATAISEIHTYLELATNAKDAVQVREWLARLEKLNGAVSANEKSDQN